MKYRIDFYLSDEVTDLEAAQKYLSSDDMTKYLKSDMPNLQDTIQHIEWFLKEKDSGYIELTVSEELDELDLDNIKEWCDGQNSDGLGAGFSEQDFACYHSEEFEEYYDDESGEYYQEDVGTDICVCIMFYRWSEFKLVERE